MIKEGILPPLDPDNVQVRVFETDNAYLLQLVDTSVHPESNHSAAFTLPLEKSDASAQKLKAWLRASIAKCTTMGLNTMNLTQLLASLED